MLKQLKLFIEEYSYHKHIDKETTGFTNWYGHIRSKSKDQAIFEHKDGGIDLIITTQTELIICQTKFGKATIDMVKAFANTISAWRGTAEKFEEWLKEVKNVEAKETYRKKYNNRGKRKLVWEFVSFDRPNTTWKNILKREAPSEYGDESTARLVSLNDVLYYFTLDKTGATYVDPLEVRVHPSTHNSSTTQAFGEVGTFVCKVNLPSLLKCLDKMGDWERILSRNVRVKRSKSTVNASIRKTFERQPDEFFYGNNGLHIIASKANISGNMLYAEQPAIINGGQTVSTLMEVPLAKRPIADIIMRITVINQEAQLKSECARFIDEIIVRSNSNNKMDSWDLRSNDEIQVEIARALFEHRVYYERKVDELKIYSADEKPATDLQIDITKLAEILACTSFSPAEYRQVGVDPWFIKGKQGKYEKIFTKSLVSNVKETVSLIRLKDAVEKATKKVSKKQFGRKFDAFPRSSRNFVMAAIWRLIENSIGHPIPRYSKSNSHIWNANIAKLVGLFYEIVKKDLQRGVSMNDIFRTDMYWMRCRKAFGPNHKIFRSLKAALVEE